MRTLVEAPVSICMWIALSSLLIIFNKRLLSGWFPHPTLLTLIHMLFSTLMTRLLILFGQIEAPSLPRSSYLKSVVPIGVLFTLSLITSNYAYIYLSVSFIQMLKASTPIVVLLLSFCLGLKKASWALSGIVTMVCTGVAMAAYGELNFHLFGVIIQIIAVIVEASRLVAIQLLLQNLKLTPLESLSLYAPLCATMLFICSFVTGEIWNIDVVLNHPFELIANACVALALNLVMLWLVKATSSLVLTLCGVAKDILLIFLSKLIFSSVFTVTQVIGYSISLAGIFIYNRISTPADPDSSSSPWLRKHLVLLLFSTFMIALICVGIPLSQDFQGQIASNNEVVFTANPVRFSARTQSYGDATGLFTLGILTTDQFHYKVLEQAKSFIKDDPFNSIIEVFSDSTNQPSETIHIPNIIDTGCTSSYWNISGVWCKETYMLRHWKTHPKFANTKWFLLLNDDSYVHMENLWWLTSFLDPSERIALGYQQCYKNIPYVSPHGGPGIILSRGWVEAVNETVWEKSLHEYWEDRGTQNTHGDLPLAYASHYLGATNVNYWGFRHPGFPTWNDTVRPIAVHTEKLWANMSDFHRVYHSISRDLERIPNLVDSPSCSLPVSRKNPKTR